MACRTFRRHQTRPVDIHNCHPAFRFISEKSHSELKLPMLVTNYHYSRGVQIPVARLSWLLSFVRRLSFVQWHLSLVRWRLRFVRWNLSFIRWRLSFVRWLLSFERWRLSFVRWRLSFVGWRLIFLGSECGTCFISPFKHLEF